MAEVLKIQKWGNSQGIRLPKKILEMLDLKVNDTILIEEGDDCLKLKKMKIKESEFYKPFYLK